MSEAANGFETLIKDFIEGGMLARIIAAFVALVVISFVCHFFVRLTKRRLSREDSALPQSTVFVNVVRVVVWAIGLSMIMRYVFGVDVNGMVAALGVGGIALSLGLQDTISNFIDGLQMSLMGTVAPGDHVEVRDRKGVVRDVTWRTVSIDTANGQTVIVPNTVLNDSALVKLPPEEKIIVPVSLYKNFDSIEDASKQMCDAVKEEVSKIAVVTKDPIILFTAVSEFAYTGNLIVWVELGEEGYPLTMNVTDAVVRTVAKLSPNC